MESDQKKSVDLGDENMEAKFKDLGTESYHADIKADESGDGRVDVKRSKVKEGTDTASDVDCVPETDSDEDKLKNLDGNNSRKRKHESVSSEVKKEDDDEDDDGDDDGSINDSHKHHHKKHKNRKKAKYREKTERRKDKERRHKQRKRDRETSSKSSHSRHEEPQKYQDRKREKNLQTRHSESTDSEEHRSSKKSDDYSDKESKVTEENRGKISETYPTKVKDNNSGEDKRSRTCENKSDKKDTDSISQAENVIGKQKSEKSKVKMESGNLFEKGIVLLQSVHVEGGTNVKIKGLKIKREKEANIDLQLEGNSSLYQKNEENSKGETSDEIKKLKSEDPKICSPLSKQSGDDLTKKDIKAVLHRHCEAITSTNINTSATSCHEKKNLINNWKVQSSLETLIVERETREVEDLYCNTEFNDSWDSEENGKSPLKTGKQSHQTFVNSGKSQKPNQSKTFYKDTPDISPKRKPSPIIWDHPGTSSQKKIKGFFSNSKVSDLSQTRVANIKKHELMKIGVPDLLTWLKHPDNIYIGRNMEFYVKGATTSKWRNPFSVKKYGRDKCIEKFEEHIKKSPNLYNSLEELTGKCLGCWCHPEPCHGHVLVRLLNEKLQMKKANVKIN